MSASTLAALAASLSAGTVSSRLLVEACLARIADPAGEGARAFTWVDTAGARAAADAADRLRAQGAAPSRWAGIPVSVKDLFDVAGQVTRAGSRVLADEAPALRDATAVQRLRQAGFVILGRTQMPEFALSALGPNPHDGTPLAPWHRHEARAPGGSSSGAAVSVADGMAHGALGSDTAGSCRIPAAFCGVVGFKPTADTVPMDGLVPLSPTLDTVGPLARSVACCASLHAVLADRPDVTLPGLALRGLRLGVPQAMVLDGLDAPVAEAFARALSRASAGGAHIVELPMSAFALVPRLVAGGGLVAAESCAWHRPWIERHRGRYDPRVLERIERGAALSAANVQDLHAARRAFIDAVVAESQGIGAMLMPTAAIVPPRLADLADDAVFGATMFKALRNAALVNLFDGCAVSLPMHQAGDAPCGLMVAGPAHTDTRILAVAQAMERVLKPVAG